MIKISEPQITPEDIRAVIKALNYRQISGRSPICKEFEENFARYIGTKYAVAVNSGTSALMLSLVALGIKEGDEVIVPNFAYIAVPNAVRHVGAIPVLVDCEPDTYNIDAGKIVITSRTRAIIAVHTYGHPCDMDALSKFGVPVIEDAAEAIGAEYNTRRCGSIGIVGCFSLWANKVITAGEGGVITTNDKALYDELQLLKDAYRTGQYIHEKVGYSMALNAMGCALANSQLKRIGEMLERRAKIAKRYEVLDTVTVKPYARHSWWMYTIGGTFKSDSFESRPGFPPISKQPPYRQDGDFAVSEGLELTCLPMTCTEQEQDRIIEEVLLWQSTR
jgi:perosamine synthetase